MIELTLELILNSVETLQKLSSQPLKARTAFVIAKLLQEIDAEINNFNKVRIELVKKYGKTDEQGELIIDENNNVQLQDDKINDFNSELQELLHTQINININKINIEELTNIEFTPSEILQLEPFIEV